MTFDEFVSKYNGKYLDWDNFYGAQCVDLVQFWSQALGGPRFTGDAKDIAGQTRGFYDWIPNTAEAVPQAGDIVVWEGSYNGGPGHVGIATGWGSTNLFEVFEQNNPTGSPAHTSRRNYNHVAGWLRKKGVNNMANYTEEKINQGDVTNVIRVLLGRDASPDDISFALVDCGASWKKWVYEGILKHPGLFENWKAEVARRDAIIAEKDKTIADLTEKLKTAQNGSGGLSEADRATITETNGIVKQIWAKITGIFK